VPAIINRGQGIFIGGQFILKRVLKPVFTKEKKNHGRILLLEMLFSGQEDFY
jgi:hypothetical protein